MEQLFENGINPKNFTKFVTPSVLMMVVIGLYSTIDSIFVANLVGDDALAALSIAYPVQGIVWGISIMLASGSSALVAIRLGEKKNREANEKFALIIWVSLFMGVLIAVLGYFFVDDIVTVMGATPKLRPYCTDYLEIMILGTPAAFVGVLFEYFIRVDGRPGFTLVLYCAGGVAHLFFDYFFMGILGWGVEGAAYAMIIGLYVVMFLGLGYFLIAKSNLRFVKPRLYWRYIGHSFANGSSEMVSESSAGITTFVFNMIMLRLAGEAGVAAVYIILSAQYMLISIHLGFITGVAPLISYYFGAKDYKKMNHFLRYSRNFVLVSSLITVAFCFFGAPLITMAFGQSEGDIYELAVAGIRIISIAFLFTGINVFASGFFTAYGNGKISALISMSRGLVLVIIGAYALSSLFGVNGVWMTFIFADLLTVSLTMVMLKKYRDHYHYSFRKRKNRTENLSNEKG